VVRRCFSPRPLEAGLQFASAVSAASYALCAARAIYDDAAKQITQSLPLLETQDAKRPRVRPDYVGYDRGGRRAPLVSGVGVECPPVRLKAVAFGGVRDHEVVVDRCTRHRAGVQ
jgi:hypothetical protein